MGAKKSKVSVPEPDYKAMASNLAKWTHEDKMWRENSLKEASNIHNRELGREKARYAASGGSKDKIGEIEARHKKKLAETTSQIESQYAEKSQTIESGPTKTELKKYFKNQKSREIMNQYRHLQKNKADRNLASAYAKETGSSEYQIQDTLSAADFSNPNAQSGRNLGKSIRINQDSPLFSDEAFDQWVTEFSGYTPEAQKVGKREEIKTRKGEKPRAPLLGVQELEENPWIG